ncbi:hypothetical protein chiPu_0025234, partial [Chiloscyllium punctatum]|nr:hypothetical protein [Chiloscyllium punctatum]
MPSLPSVSSICWVSSLGPPIKLQKGTPLVERQRESIRRFPFQCRGVPRGGLREGSVASAWEQKPRSSWIPRLPQCPAPKQNPHPAVELVTSCSPTVRLGHNPRKPAGVKPATTTPPDLP